MATTAVDRVVLWVSEQTVRSLGVQVEQTKKASADAESKEPHFGHSRICEITGACVQSPNFPSYYGSYQSGTIASVATKRCLWR